MRKQQPFCVSLYLGIYPCKLLLAQPIGACAFMIAYVMKSNMTLLFVHLERQIA